MASTLTRLALLSCAFLPLSPLRAQSFVDASEEVGLVHVYYSGPYRMGGGAAFFDADNDGDLDLYITGGLEADVICLNQNGRFTPISAEAGLADTQEPLTLGVVTGDIDNDGFRDVFVTTPYRNLLFKNQGDGTFRNITAEAGLTEEARSSSATFADFNLDGYLDLYVVNYVRTARFTYDEDGNINGFAHECFPNHLYINNGDATFTERAAEFGVDDDGCGLATAATDYDNDGDVDLYVANDFGAYIEPNVLYRNEGGARFTDVSAASGMNAAIFGMGIAVGDYDNNGHLDYYVTNLGRNVLFQNQGDGTFLDVAVAAGVGNGQTGGQLATGWGTVFFDYNNDGWLDLFVGNGHIPSAEFLTNAVLDPDKLFRNNGDGTFSDVSSHVGLDNTDMARGLAAGDYDNDGDLDLLVVHIEPDTDEDPNQAARIKLWRNETVNENHWLKLELQGTTTARDAFGAHVVAYASGQRWLRELDGGSSFLSQNSSVLHFGLGATAQLDSVAVLWPGGTRQVVRDVAVDQTLRIVENGAVTEVGEPSTVPVPATFSLSQNFPNPFNPSTTIHYQLAQATSVRLAVYDVTGKRVAVLVDDFQPAGRYSARWQATGQSAGVYFFRLETVGMYAVRKGVLLR